MIGAGMGQGLGRAVKTAASQLMNPEEELLTSVLKSYGFKLGGAGALSSAPAATAALAAPAATAALAAPAATAAGATAVGTASGGGLMAGLASL